MKSKDLYKNDAYCGNLPLFVDDVTKFVVIEGLGLYELRHEGAKRLWDVTNQERIYFPERNVRYYETWNVFHKGKDVMYDVI